MNFANLLALDELLGVGGLLGYPWSFCFERNAQSISDSIDVRIVTGNFYNVQNVDVGETFVSKRLDILLSHVLRCERKFGCVGQHGSTARVKAFGKWALSF